MTPIKLASLHIAHFRSFLWIAAIVVPAFSQPARVTFDVASVKPVTRTNRDLPSLPGGSPGHLRFINVSLQSLILRTFDLKPDQLVAPGWMRDAAFDIEATMPVDTRKQDIRVMMQNLLQDRFKLTWHKQEKRRKVLALTTEPGGVKLNPVQSGIPSIRVIRNGQFEARQIPMSVFADSLTQIVGQWVLDLTHIEGSFDIKLRWAPDPMMTTGESVDPPLKSPETDVSLPTLLVALQEQLGLQLQSKVVEVPVIVIDHAERTPTEN